jgi:hypothetical protein
MRKAQGIVGATLLYGPNDPSPDLVAAMQFLVDDLRAEGRRISGLRLGARSLRLRADEFELALTLADGPLPPHALTGITRPGAHQPDRPDLSRARLVRNLHAHTHALGLILRRRGALPPDTDTDAMARDLAQRGRLLLLPVFEATPPCVLIWQPGGLLFTTSEFLAADIATLLTPPDPRARLLMSPPDRRLALRPAPGDRLQRPTMANRSDRAERRSAGRVFGTQPAQRPFTLPQLDAETGRLSAALRGAPPAIAPTPSRRLPVVAVMALWGLLLQKLLVGWLPF